MCSVFLDGFWCGGFFPPLKLFYGKMILIFKTETEKA